jgi:uncharacterized protein YceH (UPF0502 family)
VAADREVDVRLSRQGQRVLGCLVEKALATPDHYPLSVNALRSACNQSTGRDPVVDFSDDDVRAGLDELKPLQLVRTEYARGSRVPKSAHRLAEQLDRRERVHPPGAGPQLAGCLRSAQQQQREDGLLRRADARVHVGRAGRGRARVARDPPVRGAGRAAAAGAGSP